jgi:hypothetical protein
MTVACMIFCTNAISPVCFCMAIYLYCFSTPVMGSGGDPTVDCPGYKVKYSRHVPNPETAREHRDPAMAAAADKIASVNAKQLAGSSGSDSLSNFRSRNDDQFIDRTISVRDWFARTFEDVPGQLKEYVVSLFPIATWIYRYNLTWFFGDVCFPSRTCVSCRNNWLIFLCAVDCRSHSRSCCGPTVHVVRHSGDPQRAIWALLQFYRCLHLLLLCHEQRCNYRCSYPHSFRPGNTSSS